MVPLALLIALSGAGFSFTAVHDQEPAPGLVTSSAEPSDTVQVPAPAGDAGTDRTNVQAAFDAVQPGGTVQFAPGTYLLGAGANLTVPDVTVLGHPEGTILRGCDPEAFEVDMSHLAQTVFGCTGLYVQAERQTIRRLTFEYTWHGIVVGPYPTTVEEAAAAGEHMELLSLYPAGGQRIEGNTFRAVPNGLRVLGTGGELSLVRDNDFIDVFHAIGIYGAPLHFLDNRVTVVDPESVPFSGHPGSAVIVSPGHTDCSGHVVAGNRIEGYPDPIYVLVGRGETCRDVEIRDNTIRAARAKMPGSWGPYAVADQDSTMVGAPITLMNRTEPMPGMPEADTEGVLENILVTENRIFGAEGLGIVVQGVSRSRIADNTIAGIQRRTPFPGLTWDGFEQRWEAANGSAIWVSSGSDENEIVGNTFEDIAGDTVVLEGNRNRVERQGQDAVHDPGTGNRGDARVVHVAPPTGDRETDRASILAALGEVEPGGTVQFAPGTYLMGGQIIRITVPRVTLAGHAEGTTLRGCHPDEFSMQDNEEFGTHCNGLELAGGWQTVRNLTFEHTFWALHVGCCWDSRPGMLPGEGGHLIEANTFRSNRSAVRVHGYWSEPTVIRNNRLLNNWHSVAIYGNTVHLLDNSISAPEPEEVQWFGFPADGILIARPPSLHESAEGVPRTCDNNVVSGNRIDGVTEGIMIIADAPRIICRNNIIRDNTINIRRARPPVMPDLIPVHDEADSTVVGVPLALRGGLEDTLIEGNLIQGAEGLGIELREASRNRIVNNTICGVARREPFPGNTIASLPVLGGDPGAWRGANGSGIWVSPGSDENEIVGNVFEDIAADAVVIEGDRNRVEVTDPAAVRDLGTGNRVSAPDTMIPAAPSTAPDTTRFTIIINGHRQGERRMWQEAPDTWRYEHDGDAFHFPRTERLVVDADGFPVVIEIEGQRIVWDHWIERYERRDEHARWTAHTQSTLGPRWSRTLGDGEADVSGHVYYVALHPVHDLGVLARLLLEREDRTLPLLPDGTARIESAGERWVVVDDSRRRIHLYAVHGLDLKPAYVWLDEGGATFADEWSVLAGWEPAFAELRAASDEALAEHHRELARTLVPPARERPMVIHGAHLFDPHTGAVEPGTTIVIEGARITAVGADGTLALPPDADVMDAAGRTVLPGLWDMHTHHGFPGPHFELIAPLYLAGGITTARDLGMPTEPLLSLRQRIRAGEAMGPRLLMAGWVGGIGGRPTGTLVGNAVEARSAVDRFAELGFPQIKIYSDLPHDLVPVVTERARQHGLRMSGEIPNGMTAREAVEHGYEEIQHIDGLLLPLADSVLTELFAQPTPARLQALNEALAKLTPDSEAVTELIQLLAAQGVAIDPTLTVFAAQGMEPPPWVAHVAARFSPQAQRRILDRHLFGYWPLTPLWDEILGNMSALVGALHEAGVPILPGSDTDMASSDLHQELELYVEAGIPAPEVLTLATLGAARVMGMADQLGSIEPGKLADLILVDGDPTVDIAEIRRVVTVIKDGRVYDPAAIYRALGVEP